MPPDHVHFNGSVNLSDAGSVTREIAARVPSGLGAFRTGRPGTGATGSSSNCRSSCSRHVWIWPSTRRFQDTPAMDRAYGDGDGRGLEAGTRVTFTAGQLPDREWRR